MYGFRRKLIALMVVLVATAMLLAGFPGIYFAREKVREDAIHQMRQSTRLAVKDFENQTDHMEDVCQALEAAFRSSFDPDEDLRSEPDLEQFKSDFIPEVTEILHLMRPMSLWLVFNTEHVKGEHTISFYDRNGSGNYNRNPQYSIRDQNLSAPHMQWWNLAKKRGEGWTRPYYWNEWNMTVISYARAVYMDSLMVAVLGSDFNFNQLAGYLDTLHTFERGYTLLFDDKQELVYSSIPGNNSKMALSKLSSRIEETSSDFLFLKLENTDYATSYERLKNGWTIALAVPREEIFAGVNRLFYTLLIIFVSVFLIALVLALSFSKYITNPVKSLLEKFRLATNGDLNVRANIRTNDEMRELADHFNQMMASMQKSFNELQDVQKKLTIEKERAQESDSLKSSFLENLSHEIRTPMMAIVGFSELMADPESTAKERKEFFEHIAFNSNQLVRFIEDTLLFSQLEKDQTPVKKTRFKIREVLGQLNGEFESRRQKEKPHLYFRVLSDNCEAYMYSDPNLLKWLVRYLLDNAFKFTDSGGITLVCRQTEHHHEISVSDSGIGISQNKTEMAFRKFCKVTEDRSRVYEGAGIGLTNARGLALLLNGTIEMFSVRNEGTTVTVSFPLNQNEY
ncbi:MAG: sensor histidine kinase [Marinilabilia sp.]